MCAEDYMERDGVPRAPVPAVNVPVELHGDLGDFGRQHDGAGSDSYP